MFGKSEPQRIDAAEAHRQALDAGARALVGPLLKESVQAMAPLQARASAEAPRLSLPTRPLNCTWPLPRKAMPVSKARSSMRWTRPPRSDRKPQSPRSNGLAETAMPR